MAYMESKIMDYTEKTDLEKLEFIHSTLQELDEGMIQDSIKFVEELREPLLTGQDYDDYVEQNRDYVEQNREE